MMDSSDSKFVTVPEIRYGLLHGQNLAAQSGLQKISAIEAATGFGKESPDYEVRVGLQISLKSTVEEKKICSILSK